MTSINLKEFSGIVKLINVVYIYKKKIKTTDNCHRLEDTNTSS